MVRNVSFFLAKRQLIAMVYVTTHVLVVSYLQKEKPILFNDEKLVFRSEHKRLFIQHLIILVAETPNML